MTNGVETHQHSAIRPDWLLEKIAERHSLNIDLAKASLTTSKAEPDLNNLYLEPERFDQWLNELDGEAHDVADTADFYRESAIAQRLMLSEVSRLAGLDPMTEVFNKVAFGREVDQFIKKINQENESLVRRQADVQDSIPEQLAVFMIDLDGFKATNDFIGHPAGDAVLIEVAHLLQENIRGESVVGRLGGDEFALAVPVKSAAEAEQVKARIEGIFNERYLAFQIRGNQTDAGKTLSEISTKGFSYKTLEDGFHQLQIPVRASVGMIIAEESDDSKSALAKADSFMFAQKKINHEANPTLKR